MSNPRLPWRAPRSTRRSSRLAREAAEAAIRMQPREGAYLLLADIEEAETGDQGRVRQLLAKAVRAPRDPAWVADGFVSERWAPVSPVTGRLDAFEWRVPVERLGQLIEQDEPSRSQPVAGAAAAAGAPVEPRSPTVVEPAGRGRRRGRWRPSMPDDR